MRRILDELRQTLSWFVDQREHLTLVLDATDQEVPYVLKMLDVVEQEHDPDIFLMFAHEITDANGYLDEMMASVSAQIAGVNEIRAQAELAPWPELPPRCTDRHVAPAERIKALLRYVRRQLPHGDHVIILGLLPSTIRSREAYAQVIGELFCRHTLEPWMTGVRIIVREDRDQRFVVPSLAPEGLDRVLVYGALDLGPEAMIRGLEDDATDDEIPEARRMAALVQLAALDFSHRRYDKALKKWGYLFRHYARAADEPMQALCLCGAADVLRQTGRWAEARDKYQQGLVVAQSLSTLPVALNLLLGISEICIAQCEWEDAEGFLSLADQVAAKTLQIYPKCDIMDRLGLVLLARGRTDAARNKWRAAADLSREVQHYARCETALEHLVALFERGQMDAERQAHHQELTAVRRERRVMDTARCSGSACGGPS